MASSVEVVQEAILEYVRDNMVQPVVDHAVEDWVQLRRNKVGKVDPYVAVSFGDLQPGYVYNMATARGDDYIMPVYIQGIAPSPTVARRLQNRIVDLLLGKSFEYAGDMRKRPGGNMWPLSNSDNPTEAYTSNTSFGISVQMLTIPE